MKRAASVILLCLLTAFLLAGCGGKQEKTVPAPAGQTEHSAEAPEKTEPVTEAPATTPAAETPAAEAPVTEAPTKVPGTEPATETPAGPSGTEEPLTEPPATEEPVTEAPSEGEPVTEPPTAGPPAALSAAAPYYAEYLRTHRDVLDMTPYYGPEHYDTCAAYRNVAFLDVTGDGTPEMLLICYDPDSTDRIMCFRIVTADERGAREIRKPNGDKMMNLFWDQTFVHDMTDTVLFACDSTLYFYRKTAGGERDYSFSSEEIGRLTLQEETGSLYWEIALYWEEERTAAGTKILFQAEEEDIDEAAYQAMKADLLGSADTFVLYGMPYYVPSPAYGEVHEDLSDYIAMTPSEARAYLESVSEVPFTEPPATEAPTGLAAAAGDYAEYIRTHRDDLDMTREFSLYRDAAAVYPNVAFYDLTGDGVPEMLLICSNSNYSFVPVMSFRVITAGPSGAREILKPNGDYIMNLFWDQTMAGGRSDSVLFAKDSTLYFYRVSLGDGLGYRSEETGRLVCDGEDLYWDIALEYSWMVRDDHTEEYKYQAEEKDVDENTYYSLKNALFSSADEFILYGMPAMMRPPASEEVHAELSDYMAMTPEEALRYLEGLR